MKLVETRNLSRFYGGVQAVDDVDFAIEEGETRAIIGPNGAGKTTLVSLISGRITPSAGSVWFQGADISAMPAWQRVRRGIAYTFQITSIYPALSVYENVAIGAQTQAQHGHDKEKEANIADRINDIVCRCLARVGLGLRASDTAGELAYGHQRLLEIAMGLALDPTLLILDEPTQGLSDGEIFEFEELARQIKGQTTMLLIEHNMPVVMSLADRITVMDQGSILAEGKPADIRENKAVQAAYLGA